jgi:hypothetical protein
VDLVLGGAAVSLLIVFLGALRATLRRKEGEAGAFSATAVIGGSVLGALPRFVGYAGLVAAALQLAAAVALDEVALGAFAAWTALARFAMLKPRGG